MEKYSLVKSLLDALNRDANITSLLQNASLFFHLCLLNLWKRPLQKQMFQIEFTAHFRIALSSLTLVNVYHQLGLVHHLANQTILVSSVLFVRDLSVWTVRFLGILL